VFLLSKLDKLDLRPNVENWIIYFISDRTQICKINGVLSTWLQVNLSIVQGSGIGPTLYPRERPKTLSVTNVLMKYADVLYLGQSVQYLCLQTSLKQPMLFELLCHHLFLGHLHFPLSQRVLRVLFISVYYHFLFTM
jgi:hypothetical protein